MNTRELFERRSELRLVLSGIKAELKDIDEQIYDTFFQQSCDALRADGKDFGTAHIIAGNRKYKATVRKKVTWDQVELGRVLEEIDADDARHYGKLTLAVEERKYTAAPPAMKSLLETCRTLEVGGFTIEEEE